MSDYDTIVIGSGAGGLTAALALARAGQRVLVLEQHDVAGGWCHSFTLDGYSFSPGVHYVGELHEGGRMRRLLEGLGIGDELTFLELNPDGFDHVLVGDTRFDIPRGKDVLAARLADRFPDEARGIRRYLDTVERISDDLDTLLMTRSLLGLASLPFRTPTLLRWGMTSLKRLIDAHVSDPVLKTILAAQCGDHGLPPSMAPGALHASVATHYFNGGYYPKGGGFAIPRAFVRGLKAAGGEIRLSTPVAKILVEHGRAIGVRLADGSELRATNVVSNADPGMTYGKLIGSEHLSRRLNKRLARTRWSIGALSLFMAADIDAAALGLDSGNYWYCAEPDVESIYRAMLSPQALELDELPGLFLTVTTLKDPSKRRGGPHTMEAFWFVPYEGFERWAHTTYGERPEDYEALKATLKTRMLRTAEHVIPGLTDALVFSDLGTPLTNEHYLGATRGSVYGTEKTLRQIGPFAFGQKSEIDGLTLCGASTISHGVMGVMMSGLLAARQIVGGPVRELLLEEGTGPSVAVYPCDHPEQWPEALRPREAVGV